MDDLNKEYERLIDEEDILRQRILTCEAFLESLLECTYKKGCRLHKLTIEDMITIIHRMETELRTDLLHLRFHKSLIACRMARTSA